MQININKDIIGYLKIVRQKQEDLGQDIVIEPPNFLYKYTYYPKEGKNIRVGEVIHNYDNGVFTLLKLVCSELEKKVKI